ncbi:MAG: hypothetical protein NUW01_09380 [Gemmatimonadaceae bacterium]|nr:hypothetical protein [Gemmatimonadaceae bacterium]
MAAPTQVRRPTVNRQPVAELELRLLQNLRVGNPRSRPAAKQAKKEIGVVHQRTLAIIAARRAATRRPVTT